MKNLISDIQQLIENENKLILILILTEDCVEQETELERKLQSMAQIEDIPFTSMGICFNKDDMPWPKPMLDCLYYFAPKNIKPLFLRNGSEVIDRFEDDIKIASKMMIENISYDEAYKFIKDRKDIYKKTEQMFEEEEKQQLPPTSKMLRSFAKEMWDSAKAAGAGLPVFVPIEIATKRYIICEGCPKLTEEFRCTECGCFMKTKTQLAQSSCPLGKWDKFNKE